MPAATLEQKAVNADSILEDFEKALKSRNPERGAEKLRNAVSSAFSEGKIDSYSLEIISYKTLGLLKKYIGNGEYSANWPLNSPSEN